MKRVIKLLAFSVLLYLPLNSQATWSVNIDPISGLVGLVDLNVDYQVSENWSAGVIFTTWNASFLSSTIALNGYGVRGNYLFSGAYKDSWYISPIARSMNLTMTSSTNGTASASLTAMGAMVGYWWFWNTFQLNLGYGILSSSSSKITYSNGNTSSMPSFTGGGLEFLIGWHF